MEASIANAVEPGDIVLVGANGLWGERVGDLAERYGGDVRLIHAPAGTVFSVAQLEAAFDANPGAKVLFLTHGESSTGTLQPLDGVGALCRRHGALFILDTVCSLGGVPLQLDVSGVDVTYSGSQKCLGAPPGSAPFSMSQRARDKLAARKTKVASYYFDANLFGANWGEWWLICFAFARPRAAVLTPARPQALTASLVGITTRVLSIQCTSCARRWRFWPKKASRQLGSATPMPPRCCTRAWNAWV